VEQARGQLDRILLAGDSMAEPLTDGEEKVVNLLAAAWQEFENLPPQHPCDRSDFIHAIHAAQNIVLARPTQRAQGWRWIEKVGWAITCADASARDAEPDEEGVSDA
jgi:hypothetical protein